MLRVTMAKYQAQNKRTIEQAFSRFRKEEEDIVREGMERVAKAGIAFLVEAHKQFREGLSHPHEDDTMAYAVAHDGIIVVSNSYFGGGDEIPGDARSKAEGLLSGTKGWTAIILSDMEGWYRIDWEMGFLHSSAEDIRDNFTKYFKKV